MMETEAKFWEEDAKKLEDEQLGGVTCCTSTGEGLNLETDDTPLNG